MPQFELVEHIHAKPREVFDFLIEVDNAKAVQPNVRSTEKIADGVQAQSGEEAGTHYRQIRSHAGHEVESVVQVTTCESPFTYAVETEKEGVKACYRYTLTPAHGGCEIRLACEVSAEGIRRPLAWLVAEMMRRKDHDLLLRLENAIEDQRLEAASKAD